MPRHTRTTSALRNPLDQILGTRNCVVLLRALCMAGVPLSQAELARRGGVHLRGLPETLGVLEAAGVVSFVGRGRTRQVQLYHAHPLIQNIRQLFQAETNRYNDVVQRLKTIAGAAGGGIVAAWIEGEAALGTDTFTDPIHATFLFDGVPSTGSQEVVRQQANSIQAALHVVIAVRFHQRADLLRFTPERRAALADAIILYGPAPLDLVDAAEPAPRDTKAKLPRRDASDHALAIAHRVAAKIARDPELVLIARDYVDRRIAIAGQTERLTLLEWKGLLDSLTPGQLAAFLREDSERADRLRTSLPFVGVLSEAERLGQQ